MQSEEEVIYLYLDDIIPNRFQPREVFEEKPLKELAVSIKEHGVIQPIIVRKVNDKYEIIAGERRYKASALAGLTKIPAIIRDLDDKETSKVALLENLQRKNLNPIEEARTYQKILELDEMTQEDLAKTMGKSQSSVANKLRLLSLPDEIQQALLKEQISERHARALLNIKDSQEQHAMLEDIINNKLTVRQVEEKIKGEEKEMQSTIQEIPTANSSIETNNETQAENKIGQDNFLENSPLIPSDFNNNSNSTNIEPILIPNSQQEQQQEPELLVNNNNQQEEEKTPKFINFGEIDQEENNSEEQTDIDTLKENSEENQTSFGMPMNFDINDIKANSQDISNLSSSSSGADLDSLLRIDNSQPQTIVSNRDNDESFKFFSPAEEALKEEPEEKSTADYFNGEDLLNINIPDALTTTPVNNINLNQTNEDNKQTESSNPDKLQNCIDIIKDTISKLEATGLKVEKDEMNLQNSYQVIIKIEKDQ